LNSGAAIPDPRIERIPHPRIGYAGVIAERLNWKLLKALVTRCGDLNFVFIGSEVGTSVHKELGDRPNVHYLGVVAQDRVPNFICGFDVGLLPYQYNDVIKYANPLKFFETAAAGIPSVAATMDLLHHFPAELIVNPADSADEWEAAIRQQLVSDPSLLRKKYGSLIEEYTWEAIAKRVLALVAKTTRTSAE
jgi:glycosyltransferase involved in cell wall biosynthesis